MKSLRTKVFLGVLSGLLIVTIVAELLIYGQALAFAEKELFDRLRKYAVALTEVVEVKSSEELALYANWENRLRISQEDRIQFFEFRTLDDDFLIDSHNLGGESLPDIGGHQRQKLVDYGNIVLGVYQYHFTINLADASQQTFKLIVAENTNLIESARNSTLNRLLFFTPIALIAAFIISFILTSVTLSSISRFKNRVQSYNRNDSRSQLDLSSIDKEMVPLGEAINKYIRELNRHATHESKLLADTAHELRTPLVNLRDELDQLNRVETKDEAVSKGINRISANVLTLQRMTDNMLMLYRIESGNYKPRLELFNLKDELARILRQYPVNEEIAIELTGESQEVFSNRSVLNVILVQLLNNAVQYSAGSDISISWEQQNNRILLHIDDAGSGIPEEERERIFNRHYRFENHSQSNAGGSGLGLALVRLYANSVNAETQCQDSPMGGARFTVVFPSTAVRNNEVATWGSRYELETS